MNWFMHHAPAIIAIGYGIGMAGFLFVALAGLYRGND